MMAPAAGAFEHLLRTSADSLVIYSPDWRIVFLNDVAATQFARFTPENVIGKSVFEIFPDLTGTTFEQELRRAMEGRQTTTFTDVREQTGRWASVRC